MFEYTSVYNQTDLNLFFKKYAPNVQQGTHPYLNSNGTSFGSIELDRSRTIPEKRTLIWTYCIP